MKKISSSKISIKQTLKTLEKKKIARIKQIVVSKKLSPLTL